MAFSGAFTTAGDPPFGVDGASGSLPLLLVRFLGH
jgi:hypothetical protein